MEKTVSIRGAHLAFSSVGEGVPFIWCHNLFGSRHYEDESGLFDWQGLSARVIRYDVRGHGQSSATFNAEDYTWPSLGQDILALVDALELDTFVLGGASLSCTSSLYAALVQPERVRGLVLTAALGLGDARA
jgi:3-oxoadipate enol-lactonase